MFEDLGWSDVRQGACTDKTREDLVHESGPGVHECRSAVQTVSICCACRSCPSARIEICKTPFV